MFCIPNRYVFSRVMYGDETFLHPNPPKRASYRNNIALVDFRIRWDKQRIVDNIIDSDDILNADSKVVTFSFENWISGHFSPKNKMLPVSRSRFDLEVERARSEYKIEVLDGGVLHAHRARRRNWQGGIDMYYDRSTNTFITCPNDTMAAPPFTNISICIMQFSDEANGVSFELSMGRGNIDRWMAIREIALRFELSLIVDQAQGNI